MVLKTASLPEVILTIVKSKGTECSFSGEYDQFDEPGTYLCRQCGLALFRSQSKFHSGCGWPSFDEELPNTVLRKSDADGCRTETLCIRCHAHLGHVFAGERLTAKNTRHCVNSLSLDFVSDLTVTDTEEAIFAAGCFWGVEYLFKQLPGVLKIEVGYTGGHLDNPSYQSICSDNTGHYEAVRVLYAPNQLSFEAVAKYFFEIHDPTQIDGQGPDRAQQYLSAAFYYDDAQKKVIQELISQLISKGFSVVTQVLPVSVFWRAEDYHQDYYTKHQKTPYCHCYIKRFGEDK